MKAACIVDALLEAGENPDDPSLYLDQIKSAPTWLRLTIHQINGKRIERTWSMPVEYKPSRDQAWETDGSTSFHFSRNLLVHVGNTIFTSQTPRELLDDPDFLNVLNDLDFHLNYEWRHSGYQRLGNPEYSYEIVSGGLKRPPTSPRKA